MDQIETPRKNLTQRNSNQTQTSQKTQPLKSTGKTSPIKTRIKEIKFVQYVEKEKKTVNFAETLNRMKNFEQKKEEKKKKIIEKLGESIAQTSKINENSKKILGENNEDFISRQLKLKETSEKKKKDLIEADLKKKREEEEKALKSSKNLKLDKSQVLNKIDSLYEWEKKRKEKINSKLQDNLSEKSKDLTFHPNTSFSSSKNHNYSYEFNTENNSNVIERLYSSDVKQRGERIKKLKDQNTFSFSPVVNTKKNLKLLKNVEKKNKINLDVNSKKYEKIEEENIWYNHQDELEKILKDKIMLKK